LISVPPERSVGFRFKAFLDEAANPGPRQGFQGIAPIVAKERRSFGRFIRCFCGFRFRDGISTDANRRSSRSKQRGGSATFKFQPLPPRRPICPDLHSPAG
jgi:hypothetical protein